MNTSSNTAFPRLQRATVQDADRLADLAAWLFEWTYRGQDDPQDLAAYIQEKFTPAAMAGQGPGATLLEAGLATAAREEADILIE